MGDFRANLQFVVRLAGVAAVVAGLSACADPKQTAVFVTRTSIGVDIETAPPTANIGFDRVEGFLGPRFADSAVPPVVGYIQSSNGLLNSVKQVYATGKASEIVQTRDSDNVEMTTTEKLEGEPEPMFFGTYTSAGLSASFSETGMSHLNFGFKRKELSIIPLKVDVGGKPNVSYPSVIASIDTSGEAKTLEDTALKNVQYFATGRAAEILAKENGGIREAFVANARTALSAEVEEFKTDVDRIVACVAPGGTIDPARIDKLATAAKVPQSDIDTLKSQTTVKDLKEVLTILEGSTRAMTAELAKDESAYCS